MQIQFNDIDLKERLGIRSGSNDIHSRIETKSYFIEKRNCNFKSKGSLLPFLHSKRLDYFLSKKVAFICRPHLNLTQKMQNTLMGQKGS